MNDKKWFIKLYRSPRGYYMYSVNRDTVISLSEDIYYYLDSDGKTALTDVDEKTILRLQEEGYISSKKIKEIRHPDTDRLLDSINNRMEHLVLQVTQACNLTCSYCPYANKTSGMLQRNHSNKCMSFETAKQAVDMFLEHSGERTKNVISFYGGEPLISFELIKKTVNYVKSTFVGKDYSFNMTTNATLFTKEMMDFVVANNFNLVFSIDGPEKIHNKNRTRIDGSGSFSAAFGNLKRFLEQYGDEYARHISINMVFDPQNDVDEMLQLFEDPIFDKDINVMADVADDVHLEKSIKENSSYIEKMTYQYFMGYLNFLQIVDGLKVPPFMKTTFNAMERECALLKKGSPGLPNSGAPGGPCIPGQRSIFVNVDGELFPCEKVSEISAAMKIGTLDGGIDYIQAEKLLNIARLTASKCADCWAASHCVICARFADLNGELSAEQKNKYCYKTLNYFSNLIKEYILIQECKTTYTR